jgi:hypothetical protein
LTNADAKALGTARDSAPAPATLASVPRLCLLLIDTVPHGFVPWRMSNRKMIGTSFTAGNSPQLLSPIPHGGALQNAEIAANFPAAFTPTSEIDSPEEALAQIK